MTGQNMYIKLENKDNVERIKGEIYLSDDIFDAFPNKYPHKSEATVTCICIKGEITAEINQFPVHAKAPGLLVLLPGQIRELTNVSDDFQGEFIIMTRQFTESISLPEGFSTFMSVRSTPFLPLGERALEAILNHHKMLLGVLRNKDEGLNRKAIVKHLTIALFYGLGYYLHKVNNKKKTRNEIIMEDFLKLVLKYCKQERSLSFYADRLYITTKYLSVAVKNVSGKTAGQWLDDYIILEAKSLIKTTDMTIQQISDELNFPSQSFFGKFFKREVGMSPKQYRDTE